MTRPCLALFACLAACALGADWPQILGPGRDGRSAEKGLIDRFGDKGPAVAWQRDVGDGYASPVVAGGKLYLFHRVGGEDVLECLDAATGKPAWKYAYDTTYRDALGKGNGTRATPVVAGGRVVVLGAGGQLHCVDAAKGAKVWSKALLSEYTVPDSYFGVGTSPLVEGKLVLVNVGGDDKAGVVAFDLESGKEAWRATEHRASYSSPVVATAGGGRQAVFFTREGLALLDPAKGTVRATRRWRARIDASVNASMPVLLGDDHVLLTSSYQTGALVLRLKKDGVEEVWKNDKSLSCHFGTPVAVGEQVYGFHGRQEGTDNDLRCVDWKTGKVRWTKDGLGCGSLLAADGKLFVLSEFGELLIAEAKADGYAEKARAKVLGSPCRGNLALADGLLYARDGRKLVCWRVAK